MDLHASRRKKAPATTTVHSKIVCTETLYTAACVYSQNVGSWYCTYRFFGLFHPRPPVGPLPEALPHPCMVRLQYVCFTSTRLLYRTLHHCIESSAGGKTGKMVAMTLLLLDVPHGN